MQPADAVEFSRPIAIDRIAGTASHVEIEANEAERAALAERFDLVSLDRLSAKFSLRRLRKDLIRVKGKISAALVQACVVTLEPIPAEVSEEFELDFTEDTGDRAGELDLDAEAADGPEPLEGPEIDLGEVAAEQLGLAIDPYPRKAGAEIPAEWVAAPEAEPAPPEKVNPFAELGKLKKGGEGG
jgi:uncharacterized metal-binding protein YceD (DUF177 family)